MSNADNIVASGQIPAEWADEANKMHSDHVASALAELPNVENLQVQAIRQAVDEQGNVVIGEDGTPDLVALADDSGNPIMEAHPLKQTFDNDGGFHAYRYEVCSDGSVVALYVTDESEQVQMKAFESMEEASLWSPRQERGVTSEA